MRFRPGREVSFYFADGTSLLARPFFSLGPKRKGIVTELFTPGGEVVRCLDEANGLYILGDTGRLLSLVRPSVRE